jgi:hypothetical protein
VLQTELETAFPNSSDLHVGQTLDRSYYTSLNKHKAAERDFDQVVYRHTTAQFEQWGRLILALDSNNMKVFLDSLTIGEVSMVLDTIPDLRKLGDGRVNELEKRVSEAKTMKLRRKAQSLPIRNLAQPQFNSQISSSDRELIMERPYVSLLTVQNLWMWRIDDSEHPKRSADVCRLRMFRNDNYCVSREMPQRTP